MVFQWIRLNEHTLFNVNTGMRAQHFPETVTLIFDMDGNEWEALRGPFATQVFEYLAAGALPFKEQPAEATQTA